MPTYTKIAVPTSGAEGRFGQGKFKTARFGISDQYSRGALSANSFTKVALTTGGARADIALADFALVGQEDAFTKVALPA